jgi:AAA domain-containing protein
VIVVADRDPAGRKHADDVVAQVEPIAKRTWLREPSVGKDNSDHIAAGRKLNELVKPSLLDRIAVTAAWLDEQQFAPLEYVVPGLICEGVGMLGGPPKKGKSFLMGNIALAVASGGKALNAIAVKQRPVLYLALEDGHRRLQDRLQRMNAEQPLPAALTLITKATPNEAIGPSRNICNATGNANRWSSSTRSERSNRRSEVGKSHSRPTTSSGPY